MDPVAAVVAGYPVYIFALTVDAGVALAVLAMAWRVSRDSLLAPRLHRVLDAAVLVTLAALAGARLGYVAQHAHDYRANPVTALYVWEGGLSWPGALTLGAAAALGALRTFGVPAARALDLAAPGVALGHAVGLLGCAAAGCATGRLLAPGSPLPALSLPDAAGVLAPRFPSALAEAAVGGALACALALAGRRHPPAGTVAALFLMGAGGLRLVAEPLRADSTWLGPVATASLWAAGALLVGTALAWKAVR